MTPFLGTDVDLDRAVAAMFRHIDHVVPPEELAALVDLMLDHGYPRAAILNIMGGNHVRIAAEVWK